MNILIYSARSSQQFGYNKAVTTEGKEVMYTCMWEEHSETPWQERYTWEDAEVVGMCDGYGNITHFGINIGLSDITFKR